MFDGSKNDTLFGWVFEKIPPGRKADSGDFNELIAAARKEYGTPQDSILNYKQNTIYVRWNSIGCNTEVAYSLDSAYPLLSIHSQLSALSPLSIADSSSSNSRRNNTLTPTPLASAIINDNVIEVKRLLDSGANPNELSTDGAVLNGRAVSISTPLSLAAFNMEKCDTMILKLLIDAGADPNLSPWIGWSLGMGVPSFEPLNSAIALLSMAELLELNFFCSMALTQIK